MQFIIHKYLQLESTNAFARRQILESRKKTAGMPEISGISGISGMPGVPEISGISGMPEMPEKQTLDGHVIWACSQTKGRGTRDHTWFSDDGNLFISLILEVESTLGLSITGCSEALSLSTGVGVAQMVQKVCPSKSVRIKPPNDVLLENAKVSGILIEIEPPYAIIGVGMNVMSSPALAVPTNFLQRYTPISLETALTILLEELKTAYCVLKRQGLSEIRQIWTLFLKERDE